MKIIYRQELNRLLTSDEIDGNFKSLADEIEQLKLSNLGLIEEIERMKSQIANLVAIPVSNARYNIEVDNDRFYLVSNDQRIEITPMYYAQETEMLKIGMNGVIQYKLTPLKDKI